MGCCAHPFPVLRCPEKRIGPMTSILDRFVAEISGGRCVALVGAGMVILIVPGWEGLLANLSQHRFCELVTSPAR